MKQVSLGMFAALMGFVVACGQAEAYTSKKKVALPAVTATVTESTTMTATVVQQGSTSDAAATLAFGSGGAAFRDSNASVKVDVDTNAAGNRLIIYTDNLGTSASPKATLDPAKGIDGAGLVGVTDTSKVVPMLWVVYDTNVDHTFTTSTIGDDEIYVTDLGHKASFTTVSSTIDNQAMVNCATGTAVTNTPGDGLYPQFFGGAGQSMDLCQSGTSTVVSQELSKNIAVAAFGFNGTSGTAPKLSTPDPTDTIPVTSPIYLPIGVDFSNATAQDYKTSTLNIELVTQ